MLKNILSKLKRSAGSLAALTVLLCLCGAASAAESLNAVPDAGIPRARLDESEKHFMDAYTYFMDRDYWNALTSLENALSANTYLVDYYLLSGLVRQRTGDGETARQSLASYLEVRPMDVTVPHVRNGLAEQDMMLRLVTGSGPLPCVWKFAPCDLQTELNAGYIRPFDIRGMGKAASSGRSICFTDTIGGAIHFKSGKNGFQSAEVPGATAVLAAGDMSFLVLTASGDVYSFTGPIANEPISPDIIGSIRAYPVDAALISSGEFAVADPISRSVKFFSTVNFERLASWSPSSAASAPSAVVISGDEESVSVELSGVLSADEYELLFEPVAVDSYAGWLAVADRANGRVYFLSSVSRSDYFSVSVPLVRDVLWSPLGELFALTESGEIWRIDVNFGTRTAVPEESPQGGMTDAWTMFSAPDGAVYAIDIAGSNLWKAEMMPSRTMSQGFLGIYHPTIALEANRESFLIDATLASPFTKYFARTPAVVHCIWNERSLRAFALWQNRPVIDAMVIHGPLEQGVKLPVSLRSLRIDRGSEIAVMLPPMWYLHRNTLTNIVIDSSIPLTMAELMMLTRFCLTNGIELDVWARSTVPLALARASAFTGGSTLFSMTGEPEIRAPMTRMQIQIPLPSELSSSGYPSRSMLSVYIDIGLMQARTWIPLWPDML